MSIYVILGTPGAFDFKAFSESTWRTLALLDSLVNLEHSEGVPAREILTQGREFMRAIRLGVDAAQCGFTATEDILTLARLMDSTTVEDRRDYLQGTLELADQAYSKAQEAFQVYKDVRKKIGAMAEKYAVAPRPTIVSVSTRLFRRSSREEAGRRSIEDLQKNINVLDEFGNAISAFSDWWHWMKTETRVESQRTSTVFFDDSSLRERSIVNKWSLLRNQFADYTNMIDQLEVTYPNLLQWSQDHDRQPRRRPGKTAHRADLLQAIRLLAGAKTRDDAGIGGLRGCVVI